MDRLTSLEIFVRVADKGSFGSAARELGISSALATKGVQLLEQRMGVRLLNRTTRRVSLTEVGRMFYERTRRTLDELRESERLAEAQQTTPSGVLRVNAPVSFGIHYLGPALADYVQLYPAVTVDVALSDRYVDLVEERVDVAIRGGRLPDSSLIARRLLEVRFALCAAPRYLERHGTPRHPRDLAAHNCLDYTYARTRGEWRFTGPDGTEEVVRVTGRIQANNGELLRMAAVNGGGVILHPRLSVRDDLEAGRLVELLAQYETDRTTLQAVYPQTRHLATTVRTFVDFLAMRFSGLSI